MKKFETGETTKKVKKFETGETTNVSGTVKSKPKPTRACRFCSAYGHFDNECTVYQDLLQAHQNKNKKVNKIGTTNHDPDSESEPEFRIHVVKHEVCIKSVKRSPASKDVFVKLQSPIFRRSFTFQVDSAA